MTFITPISDLHMEFFSDKKKGMPKINPVSNIIVLAGDIANGMESINVAREIAQQESKPVVWVAGNHEYYKQDISSLSKQYETYSNMLMNEGVYCVEYIDPVVLDGVRFSGCTLWTDCNLYQGAPKLRDQQAAATIIGMGLNDFRVIKNGDHTFTSMESINLHNKQYKELLEKISAPFEGKTVVVTHHGVHKASIAPRFNPGERIIFANHKLPNENTGWMLNPGFASHLPELVESVDLCIHGHTHESISYDDGSHKVIANPRGYPIGSNYDGSTRYENSNFNEQLLIKI